MANQDWSYQVPEAMDPINPAPMTPEENNRYVDVQQITGRADVNDSFESDGGGATGSQDAGAQEGAQSNKEEQQKQNTPAPVKVERQKLEGPPRPNPLFNYPDYTYNLSLHVIPPEKYNKLASEPGYKYINDDKTVLIASGGRRDVKSFQRHPEFREDFYFDTLKFTTVVGMNSRSKFSNAIDINFTLIEPYGFTLINRLLAVAKEQKTKSWMQIPFMLQIDFVGNNEEGGLMHPIPNQTKYIPVRLLGCKSKVSPRGAEYQVQCVPFGHQAFSESAASTPAMFEVMASNIKDFFSLNGDAGEAENIMRVRNAGKERQEQIAKEIEEEKKKDPKSPRIADLAKQGNALSKDISATSYRVGSYAAALNSYQQQLQTNNHVKVSEEYKFVFDPEFADSKMVFPKKTAANRTPMMTLNTPGGIAAIRAQAGLPAAGTDTTTEVFSINAGTNIIEVITMAMKNSEFIRNQLSDPAVETPDPQTAADKLGKPIVWFKIIPVVKLRDFDLKRDAYAKEITYYVKKYTYYNRKFRDAPKALPTYSCKEYHYMYTGKNQSILNFDIDFDTMFYTAITADRAKVQAAVVQSEDQQDEKDDSTAKNKPVGITNNVTQPVSGQADQVNPASVDSKATLVNDFSKSVMSSSRGDMINVKLKIIGDPELIKQDDVFQNPENNPSRSDADSLVIDPKTNSVIFDSSEVFALLTFRTPVDYDPTTGLMNFDKTEYSVFSGVYKIITVENEFSRGQFTQNLDMVRLFDQPGWDTLEGPNIKGTNGRTEEPATVAEAESPPPSEDTAEEPELLGGPPDDSEEGSDEPELLAGPGYEGPYANLEAGGIENPEVAQAVYNEQMKLREDLEDAKEEPIPYVGEI